MLIYIYGDGIDEKICCVTFRAKRTAMQVPRFLAHSAFSGTC